MKRTLVILLVAMAALGAAQSVRADVVTFGPGAYVIDMGQTPQTVANGLKPYGLIYDLVKNNSIPVKWSIEPTKGKDGIDFTADGKDYRGGPFVIAPEFADAAAPVIATWTAKGVLVDGPLAVGFTAPIYETVTGFPNVVIDQQSSSLITPFYTNAEIPATAYETGLPSDLDICDDVFAMPHADPTWAEHSNLIAFNAQGGLIYSSCHAVSVLEQIDDPGDADLDPDMNFLSVYTLIDYGVHGDGTFPYSYRDPGNPIMQFIGIIDCATNNGSEEIYLPDAQGWRPTTTAAVWDPDHPEAPAPLPGEEAAALVYGPGFGNPENGLVVYEGGHDLDGGSACDVAAQRVYFNLLMEGGVDNAPQITADFPDTISCCEAIVLTALCEGGCGPYTYTWSSDCGGSFSQQGLPTTTFTPPDLVADTVCVIRVEVLDDCARSTFYTEPVTIVVPDVAITMRATPDTVDAGETVAYAIVIENTGIHDAEITDVIDLVPVSFSYVPGTTTGMTTSDPAIAGAELTWSGVWTLAPGEKDSLLFDATSGNTLGDLTSRASVDGCCIDPAATTSGDAASVHVLGADLSLTKTADDYQPSVGQTVTFTVTVQNAGPDATGVDVTDLLPAGVTYQSDSASQGSYDDATGIWTVGTILTGASASLDVTVLVNVDTPVTNTAEVSASDHFDPDSTPGNDNPAEDDQDVAILNGPADLSLTKTDSPDPVLTSGTLTYTLTVTNGGPADAQSVQVVDTLPAGVTFVSAAGASWSCSEAGGLVTCDRYVLASGVSSEIYITVTAPATAGSITNAATVSSTTSDPDAGNNDANAITTVDEVADLSLAKSVDNPKAKLNEIVTYTLTVDNAGPDDATGVVVRDGFPAGKLAYQSDTPSQGTYDDLTGEWDVGTIGAVASATLDIVFQILVVTGSDPITNVAEVTAADQYDPDSTPNNSGASPDEDDTDSAMVHEKAKLTDLGVVKTDSADPIAPGTPLTYTITVTNHGPDKTDSNKKHEVVAEDRLPPGSVFLDTSGTDVDFTCVYDAVEHEVVCRRTTTLDKDQPKDIVINVTAPATGGTITNTATVWVDNTDPAQDPAVDTNPANDTAVEQTTVSAPTTDLSVAKVADLSNASEGQDVTYTVTLTNLGPNDATGIGVTDLLPAGVVYASDTPSQGSYNAATGLWDVGDVANGGTATLEIVATVQVGTSGTTITNTSTVTALDQNDPSPANDSDTAAVNVITLPDIRVEKNVQTLTDPVNGGSNPKAIPGATVTYTVTVTNEGEGPTDGDTVIVTDAVPAGSELFVGDIGPPGSGPVDFSQGATASGLSYTFIDLLSDLDDIGFSDDGGLTYTYVPVPDGDGFDVNVTHLRVTPGGAFAASDGVDHPSFSVEFRTRVR